MTEKTGSESPLPEGWLVEFFTKADLEHSFKRLQGCQHFHAETMRGCIRSLQLRISDAERYYKRATQLSLKSEPTIPNLIRQFALAVQKVENRIVKAQLEPGLDVPDLVLPAVSEEVVLDYPEINHVFDIRLAAQALVLLHLGHCAESAMVYTQLISTPRKNQEDLLVMYYMGLAASEHNLGLTDEALKNFENAGLCLSMGGRLLNRVRGAGCLYAFYKYLGLGKQAREWKAFIDRLDCPEETKKIFLRRGARQVERCTQQAKLVLL